MSQLLVATTNKGKLAELQPLLGALGFEAVGLGAFPDAPEAVEDGDSFGANARLKARHYASATGLPALADDSGLCVAALQGAPGIRSARFAGEHATDAQNNAHLLAKMEAVDDRRAWFACALCVALPDGSVDLEVEGRCDGQLLRAPSGAGGFGYDPLFVPDDERAQGRPFAELPPGLKQQISHRALALAQLQAALATRHDGASS